MFHFQPRGGPSPVCRLFPLSVCITVPDIGLPAHARFGRIEVPLILTPQTALPDFDAQFSEKTLGHSPWLPCSRPVRLGGGRASDQNYLNAANLRLLII